MSVEGPLGAKMHSAGFVLKGELSETRWREFLYAVTDAIGMEAVGEPAVWVYPIEGGKGGKGATYVLPITESFLALDTWSDHRGAYLFVCSCRFYYLAHIVQVAREFGLQPASNGGGQFYQELRLV
jgi:hypothetical protein